jgi:recF protein
MIIKKIKFYNFRNYKQQEFQFHSHINLVVGKNAQGKTNLIEGIYLLSLAKSFRTRINKEMIFFDEPFVRIDGLIETKKRNKELSFILSHEGKRAKIDGLEISKTSEFVGQLNVVVFTPDDLALIKGSPAIRRKFIDIELSKVNKRYLYSYNQYLSLLKERNSYLKKLNMGNQFKGDEYLTVLSEQMTEIQVYLISERVKFIQNIYKFAKEIYKEISLDKEVLSVEYNCYYDIESDNLYQVILERYQKNLLRDIRYNQTTDGIHRDDLIFKLDTREAGLYASQGQQRSIVLALKIGLLSCIYQEIGEYPVLLLDDVLSELDSIRRKQLLNLINEDIQIFITTTNIDKLEYEILKNAKTFQIEEGKLKGG